MFSDTSRNVNNSFIQKLVPSVTRKRRILQQMLKTSYFLSETN